jgi:hypothetical protein
LDIMKKILLGVTVAALILTNSWSVLAAGKFDKRPGGFKKAPGPAYHRQAPREQSRERQDANYIIRRTAPVILSAQRAVRYRHRYEGLSKAVAHQEIARDRYRQGRYKEAIYHSLRARDIAFSIIAANRRKVDSGYRYDNREDYYVKKAPSRNTLDIQIDSGKYGRDQDAVRFKINLNLDL